MKNIKKIYSRSNSYMILLGLIIVSLLSIRSGRYTYLVESLCLIFLLVYYRPAVKFLFAIYMYLFFLLTAWGLMNYNETNSIIEDILSFFPFFLLLIDNKTIRNDLDKNIHIYLLSFLKILLPISISIYIYMGYQYGSLDYARFNYNQETKFALNAPIYPILYSPYLLFFYKRFTFKQNLLVIISVLFIGFFGIITLTRSTLLIAIYPFVILGFYNILKLKLQVIFRSIMIILLFYFIINVFNIFDNSGFTHVLYDFTERVNIGIDTNSFDSGRISETKEYLNQDLSLFEILIGRGIGGHKVRNISDQYIGGINMMHIGFIHVFLKGGLLLLFILYVPFVLAIIFFWNTNRSYISFFLVLNLLISFGHTTWGFNIDTLFYWYGISMYFFERKNSVSLKSQKISTN